MTNTIPESGEQQPIAIRITLAGKTYEFSEETAENTELIALEDVTGMTTGECVEALGRGSMRILTALVWMLRRRDEPALALADVKFRARDLAVEYVRDDPGKARSNGSLTATSSLSPNTSGSSPGMLADSATATT